MKTKKYRVTIPVSGYSRGGVVYEVEAKNKKEAIEEAKHSGCGEYAICRDDLEKNWDDAEAEKMWVDTNEN